MFSSARIVYQSGDRPSRIVYQDQSTGSTGNHQIFPIFDREDQGTNKFFCLIKYRSFHFLHPNHNAPNTGLLVMLRVKLTALGVPLNFRFNFYFLFNSVFLLSFARSCIFVHCNFKLYSGQP